GRGVVAVDGGLVDGAERVVLPGVVDLARPLPGPVADAFGQDQSAAEDAVARPAPLQHAADGARLPGDPGVDVIDGPVVGVARGAEVPVLEVGAGADGPAV